MALCDGANLTGDPKHCTCDAWPQRVAELEIRLAIERRRAQCAEDALDGEKLRVRNVLQRARRDRQGNRITRP